MKALTICQPYPWLILNGYKPVENRLWTTNYRGPLAIHAGKNEKWMQAYEWSAEQSLKLSAEGTQLEFGAIVGTCRLVDCLKATDILQGKFELRYPGLKDNEHVQGPWCFVLADVKRIEPIPWRGSQGFFHIPDEVIDGAKPWEPRPPPG